MMKHVYPGGSGLFQEDNAPAQREQGVTEWFDERENDINQVFIAFTIVRSQPN